MLKGAGAATKDSSRRATAGGSIGLTRGAEIAGWATITSESESESAVMVLAGVSAALGLILIAEALLGVSLSTLSVAGLGLGAAREWVCEAAASFLPVSAGWSVAAGVAITLGRILSEVLWAAVNAFKDFLGAGVTDFGVEATGRALGSGTAEVACLKSSANSTTESSIVSCSLADFGAWAACKAARSLAMVTW